MKYITIKDIARHLSISVSTVSRALGDDKNIRKETKEKVIEAAKRLGYRPNPVAINLKYGHTNTVGVIVPEMVTPFASRVINGIQEVRVGVDASCINTFRTGFLAASCNHYFF